MASAWRSPLVFFLILANSGCILRISLVWLSWLLISGYITNRRIIVKIIIASPKSCHGMILYNNISALKIGWTINNWNKSCIKASYSPLGKYLSIPLYHLFGWQLPNQAMICTKIASSDDFRSPGAKLSASPLVTITAISTFLMRDKTSTRKRS